MGLEDHVQGLRVGLPQNFTNCTKKKKKSTLEDTFDSHILDVLCFDERGETVLFCFFCFFGGWGEVPDVRLGNVAEVFKAATQLWLQDASAFSRFLSGCCHHISSADFSICRQRQKKSTAQHGDLINTPTPLLTSHP